MNNIPIQQRWRRKISGEKCSKSPGGKQWGIWMCGFMYVLLTNFLNPPRYTINDFFNITYVLHIHIRIYRYTYVYLKFTYRYEYVYIYICVYIDLYIYIYINNIPRSIHISSVSVNFGTQVSSLSLKLTASLQLPNDGWNTIVYYPWTPRTGKMKVLNPQKTRFFVHFVGYKWIVSIFGGFISAIFF